MKSLRVSQASKFEKLAKILQKLLVRSSAILKNSVILVCTQPEAFINIPGLYCTGVMELAWSLSLPNYAGI